MTAAGPLRRQAFVGLAIALVAAVAGSYWLLAAGRSAAAAARLERRATVTLRSLADVAQRAGAAGDATRAALARAAAGDPLVRNVRLVVEGIVEASTVPGDAAPRDLRPDEKRLYDEAEELRSAFTTNREEEAAREEEIRVETLDDGRLALRTPVLREGEFAGMLRAETARGPEPAAAPPVVPALLAILVPLALFGGALVVLPPRRWLLLVVAAVLLVSAMLALRAAWGNTLAADRRATEERVARHVVEQAQRVSAALAAENLAEGAPVDPASWDTDPFGQPRGAISGTGTIDPRRLADGVGAVRARWNGLLTMVGVLGLALLLFFVGGAAARAGQALVAHRAAYLYVLPAMLAMIVLVFGPFLYGIALSFTGQTLYNSDKNIAEIWVGLANFKEILTDFDVASRTADGSWAFNYQNFYWTLFFTIAWTVVNVAIGVSVGLVLALVLNTAGLKLRPIYRVILILPWAMPNYITALIWKGMFHQQFGVINQVIQMAGGRPVAWFESPLTSFATVVATNGWLSFPFMMVVSLGALQSIPADLYEAARVDGAGRWQQFRRITLPSLKPALVPAIILSVVWTFNMFNIIYLVSAGEPAHSTEILITQAYKLAFEQYRYGYAAAYSTVIFLILLLYGTWQNRVTGATEGL